MRIESLDHLVLTVSDLRASIGFYVSVLGMRELRFGKDPATGEARTALAFKDAKINLHVAGREIRPCAAAPTPGSADLCLLVASPIEEVVAELEAAGVPIELGPVERTGATGPILSVYVRDPDANLIELSAPISAEGGADLR